MDDQKRKVSEPKAEEAAHSHIADEQIEYLLKSIDFDPNRQLSRNQAWRTRIERTGYFDFETILTNFTGNFSDPQVNSNLTKLLMYMHVDKVPMYNIAIPQYCKILDGKLVKLGQQAAEESRKADDKAPSTNLDYQKASPDILKIQEQVHNRFEEILSTVNRLPKTLDEVREKRKRGAFEAQIERVVNIGTLELINLVKCILGFGHYTISIGRQNRPFLPSILIEGNQFSNIKKLLPTLIRILQVFPDHPEATHLVHQSHQTMQRLKAKKLRVEERDLNVLKFSNQHERLYFTQQENAEDPNHHELGTEAFLSILLSSEFSANQAILVPKTLLEEIKLQIIKVIELIVESVIDSYANKVVKTFERIVVEHKLDTEVPRGAYQADPSEICMKFDKAISASVAQFTPKFCLTGFTIDHFNELMKDIKVEEDTLDVNSVFGQSIVPTLLLLIVFNMETRDQKKGERVRESLLPQVISLMFKLFSQTAQMGQIIREVMVIQGNQSIGDYLKIKRDIVEISNICDEHEAWIRYPDLPIREKYLNKVVSVFDWFNRLLSPRPEENIGRVDLNKVRQFGIDRDMQKLFRYLNVHTVAVNFLRNTMGILNSYESATDPEIVTFMQTIILFLRKFCHRNEQNQFLLAKDLPVYFRETMVEIGQASLAIEIFSDNLEICTKHFAVAFEVFSLWIHKFGRREVFLDMFLALLKCNEQFIFVNQRGMLNKLVEGQTRRNYLLYCKAVEVSGVARIVFEERVKTDSENRFYRDEPYAYHAKVLKLICFICIGKTGVNINSIKARGIFGMDYLLQLLNTPDSFLEGGKAPFGLLQLRPADQSSDTEDLANDAGRASQEGDPVEEARNSPLESPDSSPLKLGRPKLDKNSSRPRPRDLDLSKRANRPNRNKADGRLELDDKAIRGLNNKIKIAAAELLFSVYFQNNILNDDIINEKHSFLALFKQEADRIEQLTKSNVSVDYVEYVLGNLIKLAGAVFGVLFSNAEREEEEKETESESSLRKFISKITEKADVFRPYSSNYRRDIEIISTVFNYDSKELIDKEASEKIATDEDMQVVGEEDKEKVWSYLWKKFVASYDRNPEVLREVDKEKSILSEVLCKVEEVFKIPIFFDLRDHKARKDQAESGLQSLEARSWSVLSQLNKKNVVKSIIKFVEENYQDKARKTTITEIFMVLCGMIPFDRKPKKPNSGNHSLPSRVINDENRSAVQKEQIFLQDCGATQLLVQMLCDEHLEFREDSFVENLIEFALHLLEGGNRKVQHQFFEAFELEPSSPVFFQKVYNLFLKEAEYTAKKEVSPNLNTVELILQLIQRFAEGHYSNLQLLMKSQSNHGATSQFRSYNLLEAVANLLTNYIDERLFEYNNQIIQCFDTISELIQGPCFENQQVLMQGRMLEAVSKLLSIDEFLELEAEKLGIKDPTPKPQLRPWMIAKIKNKCSTTLISLIECRKDNQILVKMYTALKRYLFNNIASFFYHYTEIYQEDYDEAVFKHIDLEPKANANPKDRSELMCCVIIQTAFNFYTIIRNYQDAEGEDDNDSNDQDELSPEDHWLAESLSFMKGLSRFKTSIMKFKPKPKEKPRIGTLKELESYLSEQRRDYKKHALEFMEKKTRSIEVVREDNMLEKVFFISYPYFEAITDEIKDRFNQVVCRDSCKTKCNDLLEASLVLTKKLKKERELLKSKVSAADARSCGR